MRQTTEQNMINAFGGESMAHMRYRHFAARADKDGYHNVARLFRTIAEAEFIHAGDHYRELKHLDAGLFATSMGAFGPGDTAKNLGLAIAGETYEIDDMYPAFMAVAALQEEKGAYRSFDWSYQTEKMHKALFEKAKEAVDRGADVQLATVLVCQVCGYTLEGQAPDTCPVCNAVKEKFTAFDE
ncbi:MAG: rubrerythrin family protein [Actinobacteria bacterium]|nr:rubrerythrin family protein [Actinomycetota bacterium]